MMKKIVVLAATFMLILLPLVGNGQDVIAVNQYAGSTRFVLGEENEVVAQGSTGGLKLVLDSISVRDGLLDFVGSIEAPGGVYPLRIKGDVFRASHFSNTLVFSTENLDDVFKVIYLAVTEDKDAVYDKALFAKGRNRVLQLYLLKKDTGEFITFEIPMSIVSLKGDRYEELLSFAANRNIANMLLEHWWVTAFNPAVDVVEDATRNESSTFLTLHYDHAPAPGTQYRMQIRSRMESLQSGFEDQYALDVVYQGFYINGSQVSSEPLLFIVNCIATVEMKHATINDINEDIFMQAHWSSNSASPVAPIPTWGISLAMGFGPISGGISWGSPGETQDHHGMQTFFTSDMVQGVRVQYRRYINAEGENHVLITNKARYSSSNMPKKIGITYEFAVSFYNLQTIVMPYRTITNELTYY